MHIPRKIFRCYPLSQADTHAIPSLLTGYPQVVKFSGDESLCSRSEDSFLSRDESQKDGSILTGKAVCASGLLSMSYLAKSESVVCRSIWRRGVVGVPSVAHGVIVNLSIRPICLSARDRAGYWGRFFEWSGVIYRAYGYS